MKIAVTEQKIIELQSSHKEEKQREAEDHSLILQSRR